MLVRSLPPIYFRASAVSLSFLQNMLSQGLLGVLMGVYLTVSYAMH